MNISGHIPPGSHDLIDLEGTEDYSELMEKIANGIVQRQLTVPAIIFFESIKPLSFLGNQLLIFANPVVSLVVQSGNYYKFIRMIENRENIEKLTLMIEEVNARDVQDRRELKETRRKEKRSRKTFWSRFIHGNKDSNKEEGG
ncbi:MAG: hypothetical protein KAQ97_07660 [Candidatus Fermentibacteraceae bacterium]|nr:hypothetical protein [Candidatus Fermentibacteraceae bacterium]